MNLFAHFPDVDREEMDEEVIKIAVVGKPNVENPL